MSATDVNAPVAGAATAAGLLMPLLATLAAMALPLGLIALLVARRRRGPSLAGGA